MILKNCNTCIINGAEADVKVKARVNCIDERIILFFDDNNVLGMKTDRLEVDFCDSQVGYVKTFCELELRKNTDPKTEGASCQACKGSEFYLRKGRTFYRCHPEYQRRRYLSDYQYAPCRRR